MNNSNKLLLPILLFLLCTGCGDEDNTIEPALNNVLSQDGEWTWISGSNSVNQSGSYGTQGVASSTNVPGARERAISWTDASGNLWLFGGYGYDGVGNRESLNDLWKYDGVNWTWVSGSNTGGQLGSYGIQGTAAVTNVPKARSFSISWTDAWGNLWLFGGRSYDSSGDLVLLNDLWGFSPVK